MLIVSLIESKIIWKRDGPGVIPLETSPGYLEVGGPIRGVCGRAHFLLDRGLCNWRGELNCSCIHCFSRLMSGLP